VIDWDRVQELKDEVGAEDFRDVLEIFMEELDESTAGLRALPPGEVREDALHFLKGCALNLGFRRVSGLCQTLEPKAADGALTAGEIAELVAACEASKAAFLGRPGLAA